MSKHANREPLARRLRIPALVLLVWLAGALNSGHMGGGAGLSDCTCGDLAAGGCAGCVVLSVDPFYDRARDVPLKCAPAPDAPGQVRCTAHNTTRRDLGLSAQLLLRCANGNKAQRWVRGQIDAGETRTLEPPFKFPPLTKGDPPHCDTVIALEVQQRHGSWETPGCVKHVGTATNRGCVLVGCERCGGVKP